MWTPARLKAKSIIDTIPNRDIRSKGDDAGLFKDLTGTAHATMQADWDKGGIMTACNGWTGHYSTKLGRPGLGVFELAGVAGGAWVPSDGTARPKYGDVFRMKAYHVGVCIECYGSEWYVIEAGQGGKTSGFDILRKSKRPFDPNLVQGWVDIDCWLDPAEMAKAAVRKALKGVWNVETVNEKFVYTFAATGSEVSYVMKNGRKIVGSWSVEGNFLILKWGMEKTEHWPLPIPPLYQLGKGTWKDIRGAVGSVSYRHAY